jgi:hypothetical protein
MAFSGKWRAARGLAAQIRVFSHRIDFDGTPTRFFWLSGAFD